MGSKHCSVGAWPFEHHVVGSTLHKYDLPRTPFRLPLTNTQPDYLAQAVVGVFLQRRC